MATLDEQASAKRAIRAWLLKHGDNPAHALDEDLMKKIFVNLPAGRKMGPGCITDQITIGYIEAKRLRGI